MSGGQDTSDPFNQFMEGAVMEDVNQEDALQAAYESINTLARNYYHDDSDFTPREYRERQEIYRQEFFKRLTIFANTISTIRQCNASIQPTTAQGMGSGARPTGSVPEPDTANNAACDCQCRGYDFVSRWREKDC